MSADFLSAYDCAQQVLTKQTSAPEQLNAALQRAEQLQSLGALCSLNERAQDQAKEVQRRVEAGEKLPLAGVPIVLKDNINVLGTLTTCGSRILQGYRSPYHATVAERLLEAGAVIVAKSNMDEFAMGSSTETSIYGPTRNPHDPERVAGGSSGGSAVAVAAGITPLSLGSDTGGSVRQPASFCGVYGFKPTYGRVSRYGLVAYASSLDQIGPFARTAQDLALVFGVIAGHDARDATSLQAPLQPILSALPDRPSETSAPNYWKKLRVGVVRQSLQGNTASVSQALDDVREGLVHAGAQVVEVDLPNLDHAVATYYLIAMPEASSNLARYDGMAYGLREQGSDLHQSVTLTRERGFGAEVQRRIMLGTYALSSGYYDAFYGKALKVRRLIANDFARAFTNCDVLLTPTSPFPAFRLGEKIDDPLSMYAADVDTVAVNLAGLPALSVPVAADSVASRESERGKTLPVGVQFIAPALADEQLMQLAGELERLGLVKHLR